MSTFYNGIKYSNEYARFAQCSKNKFQRPSEVLVCLLLIATGWSGEVEDKLIDGKQTAEQNTTPSKSPALAGYLKVEIQNSKA